MKKIIFFSLLTIMIVNIYNLNRGEVIIPNEAIRLRVIPNSNSALDIYMKEKVKEYLEKDIYTAVKDVDNIDEARNIIKDEVPKIEEEVTNIFSDNNYEMYFNVNYGSNYFPVKTYKNIKYDEGFYESLVISIGEGNGDNWWCCLFPNFCLIDRDNKQEYKSYLKEIVDKLF